MNAAGFEFRRTPRIQGSGAPFSLSAGGKSASEKLCATDATSFFWLSFTSKSKNSRARQLSSISSKSS